MIAVAASALCCGPASADGPLRSFKQGLWSGGAYTDERTGVFTHCSAGVAFNTGINLFVLTTRAFRWWLGFYQTQWSLTPNAKIAVQLRFDGIARFKRFAVIPNGRLMLVALPESGRALNALRRAAELDLMAEGYSFSFKLHNTAAVLDQLTNCTHGSIALEAGGMPVGAADAASFEAAATPAFLSATGAGALRSSAPSSPVAAPERHPLPPRPTAPSAATVAGAPVETAWGSIIAIGALMGIVGQGVRVTLGLRKVRDTQRGDKLIEMIEPAKLAAGLLIGTFVSVTGAIAAALGSAVSQMALLVAAGYSGADIAERLFARYIAGYTHALFPVGIFLRHGLHHDDCEP
jgi:hypothetical protein